MDLEEFERLKARLAERTPREVAYMEHLDAPCPGLLDGCPDCVALYRAVVGDDRPTCMVCHGEHFAYEPHYAPDAATAVVGVAVVEAHPMRWATDLPVFERPAVLDTCPDCGRLVFEGEEALTHGHCGELPHTGPVPSCERCS